MTFFCSICQQSIDIDDGWVVWEHIADSPPSKNIKIIHDHCRDDFVEAAPAALWSLVHLLTQK